MTKSSSSALRQGMHGVKDEVFLSIPCILGNSGLTDVVHMTLKADEEKQLVKSAETLWGVQKELTLWRARLWILQVDPRPPIPPRVPHSDGWTRLQIITEPKCL